MERGAFQLDSGLLGRLDFTTALAEEARQPPNLMPSRVAENVVLSDLQRFGDWLAAQCATGMLIDSDDLVWATKAFTRYRPASALPLMTRGVYRALTDEAISGLNVHLRSPEEYSEFEAGVLEDVNVRYVVVADVASFYQYIGHRDLERSLVRASAKADTARALRQLLTIVSGQSYGLPQGPTSSDRLSEFILLPIEYRLARRGTAVTRFNDDFRIGAGSWGTALKSIETLQGDLGAAGLTLNEEKTFIVRRSRYESHLQEVDDRMRSAFEDHGIDLDLVAEYGADADGGVVLDEAELAAVAALLQQTVGEVSTQRGLARVASERLIGTCYSLLGTARATDGLEHALELMRRSPQFARVLGNYMAQVLPWIGLPAVPRQNSASVADTVELLATRIGPRATAWEAGWLFQGILNRRLNVRDQARAWLRNVAQSDGPDAIRSRAVLALALHKEIGTDALIRYFDGVKDAAKPDVVAALAVLAGTGPLPSNAKAVFESDVFTQAIRDYVEEHNRTTRWAWDLP